MDASRFADVMRSPTNAPSRRRILAGVAAAAFGLANSAADAGKGKKRKKKPPFNAFGCVNVGGICFGKDDLCCSGRGQEAEEGQEGQAPDEECVSECGVGAACVLNCDDEPVCVGLASACGAG